MTKYYSLLILFFLTSSFSFAQGALGELETKQQFKSDSRAGESSIQGTSTIHDWESVIEDFTINAVREGDLIDAEFTVIVESIKSGHSGMDKNTYRALKEEKFPAIYFSATDLKIKENKIITGYGNLTIAGQTKRIPVSFTMASWLEDTLTITGEITINMRDYGVEPPVALLGTVKTGEEIVFVINTTLSRVIN